MNLRIDPEFQTAIPPLSAEEYAALAESIEREGCRDPLVVWNGILIDGHNRYKICTEKNIAFNIIERNFESREEAKIWILRNQLARRNITPFTRTQIALQLAPYFEEKAKANLSAGREGIAGDAVNTRAEIAKIADVSEQTVQRTKTLLKKAPEKILEDLRSGAVSVNEAYGKVQADEYRGKVDAFIKERMEKAEKAPDAPETGRFLNGDCLKLLDEVPDNTFSSVIMDPPYGVNTVLNGTPFEADFMNTCPGDRKLADALALLDAVLKKILPKMKDGRNIYSFTSWKTLGPHLEIFKKYFTVNTVIVWDKLSFGYGFLNGSWAQQYELVIFGTKGRRRPSLGQGYCGNVIRVKATPTKDRIHSCQKPLELIRAFIAESTVQGEIVADPFAGSGSTLVAAKLFGRDYWGAEADPDIYKLALGRLIGAGTPEGEKFREEPDADERWRAVNRPPTAYEQIVNSRVSEK